MNELVKLENLKAEEIFKKNGFDKTFEEIKVFVEKQVFNLDTAKDRKEIASLAYKVSRSKTALDSLGEDLYCKEKEKIQIKLNEIDSINIERKDMRNKLDRLRDKIRLPLTNWENKEKERVKKHEDKINIIKNIHTIKMDSSEACEIVLDKLSKIIVDQNCQEFYDRTKSAYDDAQNYILDTQKYLLKKEEANALVEKLKKERAEIAEQAKKDRIEKEAKEKAEEKAKEELQKAHREKIEQKVRDEQRIKRLEQEKKYAIEKADRDKKEALEKQRREDKENADKELAEIEKQKRIQHEAEEKRKANVEHQRKINNSIYNDLIKIDCPDFVARDIIRSIARKEIKYLSINY